MVFTRSERQGGGGGGHFESLSGEVVVPSSFVGKARNYVDVLGVKIGHHHGIEIFTVQNQTFAVPPNIPGEVVSPESAGVLALQFCQSRDDLVDAVAVGVVSVVPANGFGFNPAIGIDGHAVAACVDAVIVPQFLELPQHLRTGQREIETLNRFHAVERRVQIGGIVRAIRSAKLQVFVHQPLFVVGLSITDDVH